MAMSLALLVQAAEYLEMKDRADAEHGYAISKPAKNTGNKKRSSKVAAKKSQGNSSFRSTHNELEKSRRAHLRQCLEKLKELVPLGPDATRHTTLGLLTKAKAFIKALEEKERRQTMERSRLARERRTLRLRVEQLSIGYRGHRSSSESSSLSTGSSLQSTEPESDEVDIMGYGSSEEDQWSGKVSPSSVGSGDVAGLEHMRLSCSSGGSMHFDIDDL